jgi:hypothetical protein
VTSTLASAAVFLAVVGLVIVVGIAVGMIVAGRIDRIIAPRRPAGPGTPDPVADPEADPARIKEHHE